MKFKLLLIITFLLGIGISACKKKYPEDPKRTIYSPENRLHGRWALNEYTLNGISIVDTLNGICKFRITEFTFDYVENLLQTRGNFGIYSFYDSFKDNNFIRLDALDNELFNKVFITPFKYIKGSSVKWTVTKLYKNDLHLQLIADTGEYRINFIKIPI